MNGSHSAAGWVYNTAPGNMAIMAKVIIIIIIIDFRRVQHVGSPAPL